MVTVNAVNCEPPIYIYVDDNIQLTTLKTDTDYNDEQWHHLVFIRDRINDNLVAYVDGNYNNEINDVSGDISNTGDLIIGTRADLGVSGGSLDRCNSLGFCNLCAIALMS